MIYTNGPITSAAVNTVLATFTPASDRYYRVRVLLSRTSAGSQPVTVSLPGGPITLFTIEGLSSTGAAIAFDFGWMVLPAATAVDIALPNGSGGTVQGSLILEAGLDC